MKILSRRILHMEILELRKDMWELLLGIYGFMRPFGHTGTALLRPRNKTHYRSKINILWYSYSGNIIFSLHLYAND